MGKSADFPDQSPQAAAAAKAQLDVLNTQRAGLEDFFRFVKMSSPDLLRSLGYDTLFNKSGQLAGINRNDRGRKQDMVQNAALDRELQALHGKLPVDGQTTQELNRQEAALREQLTRSLGPDYAATTAGQAALADFQQRRANIIDSASRSDATAFSNIGAQQQNVLDAQIQSALGVMNAPLPGIQILGQNAAGYGSIVQADNQLRSQQFQAEQQAAGGLFGGIGSMIGMIGGAYLGGPAGASIGSSMGGGLSHLFGGSSGDGGFSNYAGLGYTDPYGGLPH